MTPLLDLRRLNLPMQSDIDEAVLRVARSGRYCMGPELERFEDEWAAYCGVQHCIGTANALESLEIIMRALGIGPGDEVIVPSNTYIATWLSVTHCGARPVPVEPDLLTFGLDPDRVEAAITPRTKAVIAVHLYGLTADMVRLGAIAKRHGIYLFEDAAQAHGAECERRRAGSLGHAAAFSFYPSKNLGALGDAGCITTNDAELARKARRMRNYGGVGRLDHTMIGINSRMDEIQAAVLSAKLKYLDAMNARRAERAEVYSTRLRYGLDGHTPYVPRYCTRHVFHQYVLTVNNRDQLVQRLAAVGVDCHIHYPVPPHLEGAYAADFKLGDFPTAEHLAGAVMSLPIGNDENVTAEIAHVVLKATQEEFA